MAYLNFFVQFWRVLVNPDFLMNIVNLVIFFEYGWISLNLTGSDKLVKCKVS